MGVKTEISLKDLTPYFYPSDEDIDRVGVVGLFLGHYFFWDAQKQLEIVKKYGFAVKEDGPVEGTYTNYENLDEKMHGLHDYLKYVAMIIFRLLQSTAQFFLLPVPASSLYWLDWQFRSYPLPFPESFPQVPNSPNLFHIFQR